MHLQGGHDRALPDRVARAEADALQSQPRCFNDLVVEVAIIRPGPIQGKAVHPYLRRSQGREEVTYPHPLLEPILQTRAGWSSTRSRSSDRDGDRRVHGGRGGPVPPRDDPARSRVEMEELRDDFIRRCMANELPREVADQIFKSVAGFAEFGFCRSHAAAFARTAYETAWLA